MALQINATINTPEGLSISSGSYLNIQEIHFKKGISLVQVNTFTYVNEDTRLAEKYPVISAEYPSVFYLEITDELESDNLFSVVYSAIKSYLEAIYGTGSIADV